MNQRNHFLDFLKGCGCLGVVFIHVKFPGTFGIIVHMLSQYAVPVFYMTAGYYAYSASVNSSDQIIKKIRRIFRITIYANVFYFLFTLLREMMDGVAVTWIKQFASWKLWANIIVLGGFECICASHLWFLPAMIYAYLILYFMVKNSFQVKAYRLIPFLFFLKITVTTYALSFDRTWHMSGNIVCALPWMLLGYYVAYSSKVRNMFTNSQLIVASACGGVLR